MRPFDCCDSASVSLAMLYGHRKDVDAMRPSDLLMITADHGCDPDPVNPTTDHSREYVPILAFPGNANLPIGAAGGDSNLGIRQTLADMGQTVAENFGATIPHGTSFLRSLGAPIS
jgi:phosphopentomutase